MKNIFYLLFLFSSVAFAVEDLCYQRQAEVSTNFNLMDSSMYDVKIVHNGLDDPSLVRITLPSSYEGINFKSLKAITDGYNSFTANLETITKDGEVYGEFYLAVNEIDKIKILADYVSFEACENTQITKVHNSYEIPIGQKK